MLKPHFLCVSNPPDELKEMRSIYLQSLFNQLGGEYGAIDARELSNPIRWMNAKEAALTEVIRAGYLDTHQAWDCVVIITND